MSAKFESKGPFDALPEAPSLDEVFRDTRQGKLERGRGYPRVSACDTIEGNPADGPLRSHHGGESVKFISDGSVQAVLVSKPDWEKAKIDAPELQIGGLATGAFKISTKHGAVPVAVAFVTRGKNDVLTHVIPQQAIRSCIYTNASQILLDACSRECITKLADSRLFGEIIDGNLGNHEFAAWLISQAVAGTPLVAHLREHDPRDAMGLRILLKTFGPAMVSIGGEVGGHSIVLDHLSQTKSGAVTAQLRDPRHGWEIDVDYRSLLKRGIGNEFLFCTSKTLRLPSH